MPDPPRSRRTIPVDSIRGLAELLDRFENAEEPNAPESRKAEQEFDTEVERLFVDFVLAQNLRLTFSEFRGHLVLRCKQWLAAERKQPLTLPPH